MITTNDSTIVIPEGFEEIKKEGEGRVEPFIKKVGGKIVPLSEKEKAEHFKYQKSIPNRKLSPAEEILNALITHLQKSGSLPKDFKKIEPEG